MEENSMKIDKSGYQEVGYSNNGKYLLYRKLENGKGKWIAEDEQTGEVFSITYEQALGRELIRPTQTEKLSRWLGKILLSTSDETEREQTK